MILACVATVITSLLAIIVLRHLADKLGLVDHPNDRKHHVGSVPLVGGLSIFIGLMAGACVGAQVQVFDQILLGTSCLLVLLGAMDDRNDLSVRTRLVVQTALILTVIASTGVYIHTLGRLFGHELSLGWFGVPVTVVAVIGLLNAFNMMDGIDGLAGSLALVSIAAIMLFTSSHAPSGSLALVTMLGFATLPYLAANLGFMGRKIFMGDAGSMVFGYVLAWTLIQLSQQQGSQVSPVDVLWCVALPVLDTLAVMYRRLRQRKSPFKPDRGHIHHILMGMGLGPRATLFALIALASSLALIGSMTSSLGLASGTNLTAFCVLTVIYVAIVTRVWAHQVNAKQRVGSLLAANDASGPVTRSAAPAADEKKYAQL